VDIWVDYENREDIVHISEHDEHVSDDIYVVLATKPEVVFRRVYEPYKRWYTAQANSSAEQTKRTTGPQAPSRVAEESYSEALRQLPSEEGSIRGGVEDSDGSVSEAS
jgi:hypothetical protein